MRTANLKSSDYPKYYQTYIDHLPQEELFDLLKSQREEMISFLRRLEPEDLQLSYAKGKWTVAEVLQHMLDTERIFQYRALCIARKDKTSLPGFDQDNYVHVSHANERNLSGFIEEYITLRDSGISMFKSFSEEMFYETGSSNGYDLTAGAAGFIIAGHEKHHLLLFKSNYKL